MKDAQVILLSTFIAAHLFVMFIYCQEHGGMINTTKVTVKIKYDQGKKKRKELKKKQPYAIYKSSYTDQIIQGSFIHSRHTTLKQRRFNVMAYTNREFKSSCTDQSILCSFISSRHTTLIQRRFNVMTLNRRCFNVVCPLGIFCNVTIL